MPRESLDFSTKKPQSSGWDCQPNGRVKVKNMLNSDSMLVCKTLLKFFLSLLSLLLLKVVPWRGSVIIANDCVIERTKKNNNRVSSSLAQPSCKFKRGKQK